MPCQLAITMSVKGQLHPVTEKVLGVCASPAPALWSGSIQVWCLWDYSHMWCKSTSCRAPVLSAASFQWKHTAHSTFPRKRAQSLSLLCPKTFRNLSCRASHPWKCETSGKKLMLTVLFTKEKTGVMRKMLGKWIEDKRMKFSVICRKLALLSRVKYHISQKKPGRRMASSLS